MEPRWLIAFKKLMTQLVGGGGEMMRLGEACSIRSFQCIRPRLGWPSWKGGIFLAKLPTLLHYYYLTTYLIDKRPWQGQMTYIIFIRITLA